MPRTEFMIAGLKSDADLRDVMNAIQDLPCIEHSEVSLDTGAAVIDHTAMLDEGDIRAAVEAAGFVVV